MKALLLAILLFSQAPPPGVITGRVLAADGTPASKVRISVMPLPDANTPPGALPALSNLVETDASGNFRMEGVAPGRYYVVAGFVDFPTYYPGARDPAGATVVDVTSGATVSGINFRVAPASGGLKVSGRVEGFDNRTPVNVSLSAGAGLTTTVRPDGSFEFTRVPPGQYFLSAQMQNGLSSGVSVNLTDRDVTDAKLTVYRLKQVDGTVVLEGKGALPRLEIFVGRTAGPTRVTDDPLSFEIAPQQDGGFKIALPEGERPVEPLRDLPPGYSVKSFTYGNVDLTRDPLKITSTDTQQIRLTLTTSNRSPVKVAGRIVGLDRKALPRTIRLSMRSTAYTRTLSAIAGGDGAFEFPEVFPGNYTLDVQGLDLSTPTIPLVVETDIRGVEIVLPSKKEVGGRIIVEGNGPMPRLSMGWWSSAPGSNTEAVRIDPLADGTFKVALYEGDYFGTNLALPQGYTLKSLMYGTTNPARAVMNISGGNLKEFEIRVAAPDLKPVKVSGRVTGLNAVALARGAVRVSLKSSSYAESSSIAVRADGIYEFPAVLPGNYVVLLSGPDVAPNTCTSAVVADVDRKDVDIAASPGARAEALHILSAIYGANAASADVTPIVSKWMKPGLDDLYSAPKWLEVDPVNGQTKELVISYLWDCEEHLLTTVEPFPVSYAILAEHANPVSGPAAATPGNDEVTVVAAHWGMGNQFVNVTSRVRQLLRPGESFVADDAIFNVNTSTGGKVLIVTYVFEGERRTVYYWRSTPVDRTLLVQNANYAFQGSHQAPAWFKDADPFAPREPGDPGPGFGRGPRKELAIAAMLKALAELRAITPEDRTRDILTITSIVQQALSDAQANIDYAYPRPSSKPIVGPVRPASKAARLASASKALKLALQQLSSANPAPNEQLHRLSIDEIQQALTGLQSVGIP